MTVLAMTSQYRVQNQIFQIAAEKELPVEIRTRLSIRKGERNNRVLRPIIRPKQFAIKSKRATRERDYSDIFDSWRFLLRIDSRDSPVLVWLLLAAKDVDRSIDECVTADLRADVDLANNITLFV